MTRQAVRIMSLQFADTLLSGNCVSPMSQLLCVAILTVLMLPPTARTNNARGIDGLTAIGLAAHSITLSLIALTSLIEFRRIAIC